MSYVIWRLHRTHVLVTSVGFAALAALLIVTGVNMSNTYDAATSACRATGTCGQLPSLLFQGDGPIITLVTGTMILPALLGVLWGAPLIAGELESGTRDLAWTQSVTRRRWMATNLGWAIAVAFVWGAALTIVVSWWRIPENGLYDRFSPGAFDIQGVVPIAYSIMAMALGISAGVVLRRAVPAVATAFASFIALRALFALFLRQHFIAPVTETLPVNVSSSTGPVAHVWWIASYIKSPDGRTSQTGIPIPAACQTENFKQFQACIAAHGYHRIITYQPPDRFWTFQAIEAGIFVLLAAALLVFAYRRITTADA
jgi:hypothetical protein